MIRRLLRWWRLRGTETWLHVPTPRAWDWFGSDWKRDSSGRWWRQIR